MREICEHGIPPECCEDCHVKVVVASRDETIRALRKEVEELRTRVEFSASISDIEEKKLFDIEQAARASFKRYKYSVRGQQVTALDSYDTHLTLAALNYSKAERDSLAEQLTVANKFIEAAFEAHPNLDLDIKAMQERKP